MIKPFRDNTPRIHETAFITDDAIVIGDVEIGAESSVWFGSIIRGDVNHIRIGERTNIQDSTVIHVSSKDHATILEDEITVGHRVTLHGCYVEKCCLIGIGSIILDEHGSEEIRLSPPAALSHPAPSSRLNRSSWAHRLV
jgi:carbonic anhydrase/acetyltransferase-like protein (isoleucine patch superfamily)